MKFQFRVLLFFVGLLIKVIDFTLRYRYYFDYNINKAKEQSDLKTFIFAIWHRHAFLGITSHPKQKIHPLVSHSKDGELVTYVAKKFGLDCIRGSSSRGGFKAMRVMLTALKKQEAIAITVDGPKGPALQVKPGVVELARVAKTAIVPMIAKAEQYWVLQRTWDKTLIPKPFSKVVVAYGEPLIMNEIEADASFIPHCERVENALKSLEKEVDEILNSGLKPRLISPSRNTQATERKL